MKHFIIPLYNDKENDFIEYCTHKDCDGTCGFPRAYFPPDAVDTGWN